MRIAVSLITLFFCGSRLALAAPESRGCADLFVRLFPQGETIEVRRAQMSNAREINLFAIRIEEKEFGAHYPESDIRDYETDLEATIQDAHARIHEVRDRQSGELVATGGLKPDDSEGRGYIYYMYVASSKRGEGFGSSTLRLLIQDAEKLGYKKLTLNATNPKAIRLYQGFGFTITGTNSEGESVMVKVLDN